MSLSKIFADPFRILFYLILCFYVVLYGPYGIEDGDMGSIFGISWSMYNGYFPHRDFVYIKPAFSPFFHSLPLYISEDYGYLINRYFYFIQVFSYSYLASRIAFKVLKLSSKNLYFIAILGALVSIHNYPPMPWNTIDGIFFSVLGLYFLVSFSKKSWSLILSALFLFLGILCKQSFFFFPLVIGLFIILRKDWKTIGVLGICGISLVALFLLLFWRQNALDPFIEQLFSFTTGTSFIDTALKSYYLAIKGNIISIVISIGILWLLNKYSSKNVKFFALHLIVVAIFLWLYWTNQSLYTHAKYGIIHLLWLSGMSYSLFKSFYNRKYDILVIMFALGWCASISNGYNTPIDFSTPSILFLALLSFKDFQRIQKWLGILIIGLYLGTFYYGYQFPYREKPRKELTHHVGDIFPRLNSVYTHVSRYEKYRNLKELSERYSNYTILPSMTLGHYITNTVNPIGVDWVFNHHLANELQNYKQKLKTKNVTVFIENFENHQDNYEESSQLTMHVVKHWNLIEKTEYFRVFQKP